MRLPLMVRPQLAATLIVASATLLVAFESLRGRQSSNSQPAETKLTAPADALEVELITLRPFGLEPAEITRNRGTFVLFVDDRSGREGSTLTLAQLNGDRQKEIRTNKKKSDSHDLVDLAPGVYLLIDDANPESNCRITILP